MTNKFRKGQRVLVRVDQTADAWISGVIHKGTDGVRPAVVTVEMTDLNVFPNDLRNYKRAEVG